MKNRALLFSIAVAALTLNSTGPSAAPADPPQHLAQADPHKAERDPWRKKFARLKDCDASECSIKVTVTGCDKAKIIVDPEELAVVRTRKGMRILWKVENSPGYTFEGKKGIFYKGPNSGGAGKQFQCKLASKPGLEYECHNRNEDAKPTDYEYGITILKDGKTCATKDPIIINGF
jgi:hypothetical protein